MKALSLEEFKAILNDAYRAGEKGVGFEKYFEELGLRAKSPYACPSELECTYPNCKCEWSV